MNRHERRAARSRSVERGDVLYTAVGHLLREDLNYGLPVICYTCGAPHQGHGVGRITFRQEVTHVPLCEPCVATPDETQDAITRKFWDAPDLKMSGGGPISDEQIEAMVERLQSDASIN